jgi:hypothetical protein
MSDTIAFFAHDPGIVECYNFETTVAVRVRVREGKYVIVGTLTLGNFDGDQQNASAQLRSGDGGTILDQADLRVAGMDGDDPQWVSVALLGTLEVPEGQGDEIVDIACASYNVAVKHVRLVATRVDDLIDTTV